MWVLGARSLEKEDEEDGWLYVREKLDMPEAARELDCDRNSFVNY